MDKIKFARMINLLSHWGMRELDVYEMQELDKLTTVENQIKDILPQRAMVLAVDVENLMKTMFEKTHKIEAIKFVRQITDLGLKDAKDLVERYW